MATATPERASPEFPIALLSRAVAASTAMLQLIAAVAAISLDRVLEAEGTARARARDPARGRAGLTLLGGVALTAGGVAALATRIPALWILRGGRRRDGSQMNEEGLGRRPCTSTRSRLATR